MINYYNSIEYLDHFYNDCLNNRELHKAITKKTISRLNKKQKFSDNINYKYLNEYLKLENLNKFTDKNPLQWTRKNDIGAYVFFLILGIGFTAATVNPKLHNFNPTLTDIVIYL